MKFRKMLKRRKKKKNYKIELQYIEVIMQKFFEQ